MAIAGLASLVVKNFLAIYTGMAAALEQAGWNQQCLPLPGG
jgi:hypothetical protein